MALGFWRQRALLSLGWSFELQKSYSILSPCLLLYVYVLCLLGYGSEFEWGECKLFSLPVVIFFVVLARQGVASCTEPFCISSTRNLGKSVCVQRGNTLVNRVPFRFCRLSDCHHMGLAKNRTGEECID